MDIKRLIAANIGHTGQPLTAGAVLMMLPVLTLADGAESCSGNFAGPSDCSRHVVPMCTRQTMSFEGRGTVGRGRGGVGAEIVEDEG